MNNYDQPQSTEHSRRPEETAGQFANERNLHNVHALNRLQQSITNYFPDFFATPKASIIEPVSVEDAFQQGEVLASDTAVLNIDEIQARKLVREAHDVQEAA